VLPALLRLSTVLALGALCLAAAQFYLQLNLVSDGAVPAGLTDTRVVNAWGLVSGPTTPWWISDNGTGLTTLYNVGTGTTTNTFTLPGAGGQQGTPSHLRFHY